MRTSATNVFFALLVLPWASANSEELLPLEGLHCVIQYSGSTVRKEDGGLKLNLTNVGGALCEGQELELETPSLKNGEFLMTKKYGPIKIGLESYPAIPFLVTETQRSELLKLKDVEE